MVLSTCLHIFCHQLPITEFKIQSLIFSSNIGTQGVQELLFFCGLGDRSIHGAVYTNGLVNLTSFWLRCTARKKLGIYDVHTTLHR